MIVPTRARGNASRDALRPERHSHADGSTPRRGNDQQVGK